MRARDVDLGQQISPALSALLVMQQPSYYRDPAAKLMSNAQMASGWLFVYLIHSIGPLREGRSTIQLETVTGRAFYGTLTVLPGHISNRAMLGNHPPLSMQTALDEIVVEELICICDVFHYN